ncbi:hypothetical protein ElyMa_004603700 [Elysia marginata]|uniref:Uncharacterized protein n=1 Tax=Elysia marginata TaxID=1093978 RepID=A0AAV4HWH8_9GAST|nr:hypothetical protein ElyMa_004603700 [Elysia marginata]
MSSNDLPGCQVQAPRLRGQRQHQRNGGQIDGKPGLRHRQDRRARRATSTTSNLCANSRFMGQDLPVNIYKTLCKASFAVKVKTTTQQLINKTVLMKSRLWTMDDVNHTEKVKVFDFEASHVMIKVLNFDPVEHELLLVAKSVGFWLRTYNARPVAYPTQLCKKLSNWVTVGQPPSEQTTVFPTDHSCYIFLVVGLDTDRPQYICVLILRDGSGVAPQSQTRVALAIIYSSMVKMVVPWSQREATVVSQARQFARLGCLSSLYSSHSVNNVKSRIDYTAASIS